MGVNGPPTGRRARPRGEEARRRNGMPIGHFYVEMRL